MGRYEDIRSENGNQKNDSKGGVEADFRGKVKSEEMIRGTIKRPPLCQFGNEWTVRNEGQNRDGDSGFG